MRGVSIGEPDRSVGMVEELATLAVLIGVAIESLIEFTLCIKQRRRRSLWGRIAALLLIAGIAEELIAQYD